MPKDQIEGHLTKPRWRIFWTYLLLGPPIGGFFFIVTMIIAQFIQAVNRGNDFSEWMFDMLPSAPNIIAFTVIFSYLFGSVQAGATGLSLAIGTMRQNGCFTYLRAAVTALIVCIITSLIFYGILTVSDGGELGLFFGVFVMPIGVASSLTLRFLFRNAFSPVLGR